MSKSRAWIFTINNPTGQEDQMMKEASVIKRYIGVLEIGSTGTIHYQGALQLNQPRAISALKKIHPTAHWEIQRGTPEEAYGYVMKTLDMSVISTYSVESYQDTTYLSNGTSVDGVQTSSLKKIIANGWDCTFADIVQMVKGNVHRPLTERLAEIQMKLKNGIDDQTLANEHFEEWIKYGKRFNDYRLLNQPPRDHEMEIIVIQGPAGTGKSRFCRETYPEAYWKSNDKWWENYQGQETVIMDDFYGNWMKYNDLLRLCDRYPMDVEIKGGKVAFISKRIIFTTNIHPSKWYSKVYFTAFIRRVTEWWVFGTVFHSKYKEYKEVRFIELGEDTTGDLQL